MRELAHAIWHYQIQVVPVFLAVAFFELPNYLRRRHGYFYVPLYFSLFPLRELNRDLAVYLGDDYWSVDDQSETRAEALRKRMILRSVGSMFLAAVAIPAVVGFLCAFLFGRDTLVQFIVTLLFYKLIGIVRAIRDFHTHARGSRRNRWLVALIYAGYLGVVVQMVRAAYLWATPFVNRRDWAGLAAVIGDLVFGKAIAQGIVLAALTAVIISLLADRQVRQENLERYADIAGDSWHRARESGPLDESTSLADPTNTSAT